MWEPTFRRKLSVGPKQSLPGGKVQAARTCMTVWRSIGAAAILAAAAIIIFGITSASATSRSSSSTASSASVEFVLDTTLDLSVSKSSSTDPFRNSLVMKLPSECSEVAILRANEVDSDAYARALEDLLVRTRLFPTEESRRPIIEGISSRNPPRLVIADGTATLSMTIPSMHAPWKGVATPPTIDWTLNIGTLPSATTGTIKELRWFR
jgi:hypothetical protein